MVNMKYEHIYTQQPHQADFSKQPLHTHTVITDLKVSKTSWWADW